MGKESTNILILHSKESNDTGIKKKKSLHALLNLPS